MNTAARKTFAGALLAIAFAPPIGAASLEKAIDAMQAGRTEAAEREFTSLVRDSSSADKERAQAYFYLGAMQQLAVAGEESRAGLEAARRYYESALAIDPKLGGALNNLARVQSQLGQGAAALETIDLALALKDSRYPVYQATRADIAERSGDVKLAGDAAQQALFAAPQDPSRRQKFAALALKSDPRILVTSVDRLIERGESVAAQAVILDALPEKTAPQVELLERLADTLAAQSYDPRGFATLPAGLALAKLADDALIGTGARELLALHAKADPARSRYNWWMRDFRDHGLMKPNARARRFARLASSLAHWYRDRNVRDELPLAAPYAELALSLSGDSLEPRAILDLAGIYADIGQREKIRAMSDRYVQELFQGKSEAYHRAESTRDYRSIYDYHMALGAIYGYLGQWKTTTGWEPASAIFQLEHARTTAQKINAQLPAASRERVIVPATAIQLLAKAYDETGRADDSVRLRIDAANERLASPNPKRVYEVLQSADKKPVDVSRTSPKLRGDWKKLEDQVATLPDKPRRGY